MKARNSKVNSQNKPRAAIFNANKENRVENDFDEYDFNNETFERWFYGKLKLDEYDFMLQTAFEADQELAFGIE